MESPNPYWYRLADGQRRGVVECLRGLGYSLSDIARAAGVNPSTVHAWLSGRAAPQVDKLERLYGAMPNAVEQCLPEPPISDLDIMQALSVIAKALKSKKHRDYVIEELSKLLPGGLRREVAYRVEREDVELFKAKLAAEGVSRSTAGYYVRYLVRFLNEVGWTLSPESLQRVYAIKRPRVMGKTAVALKRFIDAVVKVKDPHAAPLLYDAFKTVRSRPTNGFKVPALEDVRRVWEEAHRISPCAAAVWGIMAETGVRFEHLHKARLDGLQLERRRIILGEVEGPKRQPLVFLTEGAARYLAEVYMPWRAAHVEETPSADRGKLIPCKEHNVYGWLKEARERAGLPWLEPRLLRKFNAQYLLDAGADLADIAVLQGRALPSGLAVTVEHYIADYERRLRQVFERYAPRVFP